MTVRNYRDRSRAGLIHVTGNLLQVVESGQTITSEKRGHETEQRRLSLNRAGSYRKPRVSADGDALVSRREMEIARDVQRASFPQPTAAIPGLTCATFYEPARTVGGDYYDFIPLPGGAWGIAIGDVSGKGIGAALVMASLQASLRAQVRHARLNIETLMTNINELVGDTCPEGFFVSLFYGEYQPATRILRYVNAGHNAPLVLRRRDDQCEFIPLVPESVPLGVFEASRYMVKTFELETDDVLVAYTDGITESEDVDGNLFGSQRLQRILRGCCSRDPQYILREILNHVSAYSMGCPQKDDITLAVMHVDAEVEGS
jgi:phosphoserine phosphatase RsbU/P